VLLGERRARMATLGLMTAFYPTVIVLAAVGALPWWSLLSLAGVERLARAWPYFLRPRPDAPPPELEDYPVWPLWFTAAAFLHTRRAGALFVLGLAIEALIAI
jgi:1,4-dihydroxy-2-naphthoate octaprenyltransferase